MIDMADCAAMLGDKARALALTAEALRLAPKNSEVQYMAADIYETLGDRASALRWLEAALRAGYQRTLLETSPSFAKLRTDPRYTKMIASLPAAGEGGCRNGGVREERGRCRTWKPQRTRTERVACTRHRPRYGEGVQGQAGAVAR